MHFPVSSMLHRFSASARGTRVCVAERGSCTFSLKVKSKESIAQNLQSLIPRLYVIALLHWSFLSISSASSKLWTGCVSSFPLSLLVQVCQVLLGGFESHSNDGGGFWSLFLCWGSILVVLGSGWLQLIMWKMMRGARMLRRQLQNHGVGWCFRGLL